MAPTDRVGRYPKHNFQVRSQPFVAQPFLLARVLPGETMSNLFFESRVITDPIRNPIIGWKKEYYFFYVKVTDLMIDAIRDMFVDPTNASVAGAHGEAANVQRTYTAKGGVDWTQKCLDKVVLHWFRDQDETAAGNVLAAGDRLVQIRDTLFLDSLTDKDLLPEGDAIAGATDAGDLDRLMDAFNMLRAMGVANLTYEDWLRQQGIAVPEKDEGKPELLDRFTDFQYPSNTINAATGAPTSAVSWVFKQSSRKPKFFKEPGFVIGVSVVRPKVYFSGLAGSAAGFATRAWDWTPDYLRAMPETSLKQFTAGTGPLGDLTTDTDAYWLDMRDELLYGDQFQNMAAFNAVPANDGTYNLVALPLQTLAFKYPTENMVKSFFVDSAGTAFYIRQDGYASLSIKGHETDHTVGNLANL